ncbi:AAA-like domain-containing protein [Oscillochloris sp. ZM17-4]|uniref:AAA-like domain-containing protein n=1 Tax=Oscillochloris sp. ZM17-4 TaxID=2866714 RepID=UPI001C73AE0E|nr:AAA-like domain-containing protein [Oscillochloris sp. ZM17-4]MBX0331361.1 AAA-like domain-containing protein [Oscillochloris sp. ZM17-4]
MTKPRFVAGGTVQAGDGIYIDRLADEQLLQHCKAGDFTYVLTARQMGKSSLMTRVAERLEAEGVRTVLIDLTDIGAQASPDEWYLGILDVIVEELSLKVDYQQWWSQHSHLSNARKFGKFLREVILENTTSPLVIFVDEIDTTRSLSFSADDFFAAIRAAYNARSRDLHFRRLSFVLLGVAQPTDLIHNPKRTPFNIGVRIDLTDFTLQDAAKLGVGFGLPSEQAITLTTWILNWTGGHPYLTQRLCKELVVTRLPRNESELAGVVEKVFFKQDIQDHNIRFVRDMLIRKPYAPSVLKVYADILADLAIPDNERLDTVAHLKLSGVVRSEDGLLAIRNAIYKRVFNRTWIMETLRVKFHRSAEFLGIDITSETTPFPELATNLRVLLDGKVASDFARSAPERLLSSVTSIILTSLIGTTGFVITKIGFILNGIEVLSRSAMLEQLITLSADSVDECEYVLHDALKQQDLDIALLSALLLNDAGPDLTLALPIGRRSRLIDGLERGMHMAGGALKVIAPLYADALRDLQINWVSLQKQLRVQILNERAAQAEVQPNSSEVPRRRTSNPDPLILTPQVELDTIQLTISFTSTSSDRVAVRWESDVIGVRSSQFIPPYNAEITGIVMRALNSKLTETNPFNPIEISLLSDFDLIDTNGSVAFDIERRIGRALYRALTADSIGATSLNTARDFAISANRRLTLNLRFPPDAIGLMALPWELLWDDGPVPLLLSRSDTIAITRHFDLSYAFSPPRKEGPLRILLIEPHFGSSSKQRELARTARMAAFQPLLDTGQVLIDEISPATLRSVVDVFQFSHPPDIVHYIGYGRYADGKGALMLDEQDGRMSWVSIDRLTVLFGDVKLVVLQTMQSALVESAVNNLLTGVAPALSMAVPSVIGMQLGIRMNVAARAIGVIYRALAAGQSLQDAVNRARQALYIEEADEASWFIPVLYIRSRDTGPVYMTSRPAFPGSEAQRIEASIGSKISSSSQIVSGSTRRLNYDRGLATLREHLGNADAAIQADLNTLEFRLKDNLRKERLFGLNQTISMDRSEIIYMLNELALRYIEKSFNDLARS